MGVLCCRAAQACMQHGVKGNSSNLTSKLNFYLPKPVGLGPPNNLTDLKPKPQAQQSLERKPDFLDAMRASQGGPHEFFHESFYESFVLFEGCWEASVVVCRACGRCG